MVTGRNLERPPGWERGRRFGGGNARTRCGRLPRHFHPAHRLHRQLTAPGPESRRRAPPRAHRLDELQLALLAGGPAVARHEERMRVDQKYAVWLADDVARAFLGIDTQQPQSRWVVLGQCIGEEASVGFWLRIDHIEQWIAMSDTRNITVSPPECLIRWADVITIQALEKFEGVKVVAGFQTA